jgi:hypothetical protein
MTASSNWFGALRAYLAAVAAADLAWEVAHLPLYTLWQTVTIYEQLFTVAHCTTGDIIIALSCLVVALILAGHREWAVRRFVPVMMLTLLFA